MLLFMILGIALILLIIIAILALGAGTAIGTIIFSDVIVCCALIVLLIRYLMKKGS
mgnify:FL=1